MRKIKLVFGTISAMTFIILGAVVQNVDADVNIKNKCSGSIDIAVANSVGDSYGDVTFKNIPINQSATWWRNSKEGALVNVEGDIYFVSSNFNGYVRDRQGQYNPWLVSNNGKMLTPIAHLNSITTKIKPVTVTNQSDDGNPFYDVTLSTWWHGWEPQFGDATNGNKFSLYAPWFSPLFNSQRWGRTDNYGGSILGVNGARYYYVLPGDSVVLKNGGIPYYLDGTKVKQVYKEQ